MSKFNLNEASESSFPEYQRPGICKVTFTEVKLDKTGKNSIPFIKLITKSESGAIGNSSQMFLSTEVKAGKKMAAWNVTARNLVNILKAARNCSEEEAKSLIVVDTQEQLVAKLSALLIGREVRAKFKGETSEKGNVFAILAQTESITVPEPESILKYDPNFDIKEFQGVPQNNNSAPIDFSTSEVADKDLPF